MKIEAVIFDLDGTLVDTVEDIASALNKTLAELELAPHSPERVRTMVGGGLGKLLERALDAHGASLHETAKSDALRRLLDHYAAAPAVLSRVYPGTRDTLGALREAGGGRVRGLHQQASRD